MSQPPTYNPPNSHPLSTLWMELVWEGKYDEYGQQRQVDLIYIDLLFDVGADFSMSVAIEEAIDAE